MRYRFIAGLVIGLSFAAGVAYSAGTVGFFTTAPSASGQCVTTAGTDGSLTAAGCTGVTTIGTNTYTAGSNTFNSGVSLNSQPIAYTSSQSMLTTDCGHTVVFTGAGPFTYTVITASVPVGCSVAVAQGVGAGQVTIGGTFTSINSYTKTKGPGAIVGLFYTPALNWLLSGDGA